MPTRRFVALSLALALSCLPSRAVAQQVTTENRNGVTYQVTTQKVHEQVPVTVMQNRQQTVYSPQITTQNISQQQAYVVPVTQYQTTAVLRGRWNPFVTPYWTYNVEPVTTWHNTVASVQIPVNQISWVPQTQTYQVPVTEFRTAEKEITTRVALNNTTTLGSNQALASTVPTSATSSPAVTSLPAASNSYPTATIAARPSVTSSTSLGGTMMESDPPRQSSSGNWSTPPGGGRRY